MVILEKKIIFSTPTIVSDNTKRILREQEECSKKGHLDSTYLTTKRDAHSNEGHFVDVYHCNLCGAYHSIQASETHVTWVKEFYKAVQNARTDSSS